MASLQDGAPISISNAHVALVTSAGFLLDQMRLGRGFFDFVDALIITAVTQANVDPVLADPELQRTYATYDAPPPEELRRPISINALAESLGLPFETVRRRTTKLLLLGVLRTRAGGVWTPLSHVRSRAHRRVAEAAYDRTRALYDALAHLPEFSDLSHGRAWVGAPPLRAVARLSGEYLLRLAVVFREVFNDPVDAAIWLEVVRSATGAPPIPGGAWVRMSASRTLIAKRLGLPGETVRRRIANLIAHGACAQDGRGPFVPAEVLARAAFQRIADRNQIDLRRLFSGLASMGVLAPMVQTRCAVACLPLVPMGARPIRSVLSTPPIPDDAGAWPRFRRCSGVGQKGEL